MFYNVLKQQPHESSSVNEVVLRTPGKAGRFGAKTRLSRRRRYVDHASYCRKLHYCFFYQETMKCIVSLGPIIVSKKMKRKLLVLHIRGCLSQLNLLHCWQWFWCRELVMSGTHCLLDYKWRNERFQFSVLKYERLSLLLTIAVFFILLYSILGHHGSYYLWFLGISISGVSCLYSVDNQVDLTELMVSKIGIMMHTTLVIKRLICLFCSS